MKSLPPRRPDWHPRLLEYLALTADWGHEYGTHDCALFVAGAVEAMHGADPGAPFFGQYKTYGGGVKVLRQSGFQDMHEVLAKYAEQVPPIQAQIGDIAALPGADHAILGIVTGPHIRAVAPSGAVTLPLFTGPKPTAVEVWRT